MTKPLTTVLPPRPEGAAPEAAAKTLDAREADALHHGGVAVEDGDAAIAKRRAYRIRGAALEVVIAEDRQRRHAQVRPQLPREALGLFEGAVVGEVSKEQHHIRPLPVDGLKDLLQDVARLASVVQIADGADAEYRHGSARARDAR